MLQLIYTRGRFPDVDINAVVKINIKLNELLQKGRLLLRKRLPFDERVDGGPAYQSY